MQNQTRHIFLKGPPARQMRYRERAIDRFTRCQAGRFRTGKIRPVPQPLSRMTGRVRRFPRCADVRSFITVALQGLEFFGPGQDPRPAPDALAEIVQAVFLIGRVDGIITAAETGEERIHAENLPKHCCDGN